MSLHSDFYPIDSDFREPSIGVESNLTLTMPSTSSEVELKGINDHMANK
jgi:hypothetical protein